MASATQLDRVRARLEYWRPPRLSPEQLKKVFPRDSGTEEGPRYVTMEVDFGGFNNIRQGFEVVLAAALLTGRTLVLPPSRGWYLINWGPQTRNKHTEDTKKSTSLMSHFFDIAQLRKFIPVITTDEFLERERVRFSIPAKFTAAAVGTGSTAQKWHPFDMWWREQSKHVKIMDRWNPLRYVVCWPSIAEACSKEKLSRLPEGGKAFIDRRQMSEGMGT
eukprot:CAMPEP_0115361734 /NCGR_PEP_ID=MMETSP0270-20121206/102351_1 /TAXON_ID=71861 /ORGANISM="Scrippsiella trochoidea, Strain CCMP3099" /LENGTH=218 /DNA_ID=CAMNT_0002784301 /DNA_START=133 /DNA_END=786 /DNA_ORIENTATION=-